MGVRDPHRPYTAAPESSEEAGAGDGRAGALLAAEARFLIVGGYAVGAYGHPRAIKDPDVWVELSDQNASHVYGALCRFGAPLCDLKEQDLASARYGLMMGARLVGSICWPPFLVLISIRHGVSAPLFNVARGSMCPFISLRHLIENKRAAGLLLDLADIEALSTQLIGAKPRASGKKHNQQPLRQPRRTSNFAGRLIVGNEGPVLAMVA